jgi:hypothetical protein
MFQIHQVFESVGDVWVWWALCLLILAALIGRAIRTFAGWVSVHRFLKEERGASYVLPYVFTLPWVMLVFAVMIQATLILIVKFGNLYAGYAAARAAIVWRTTDKDSDERGFRRSLEQANRAAIVAMAPFAPGQSRFRDRPLLFAEQMLQSPDLELIAEKLSEYFLESELYAIAYRDMAEELSSSAGVGNLLRHRSATARSNAVVNKYRFAALATRASFERSRPGWNQDFEVKVSYMMPMQTPLAGRILGSSFRPFYARPITSTVVLPSEEAESDDGTIGIPYEPTSFSPTVNLFN